MYMRNEINKNFVRCGVLGWCMEVLFTSVTSINKKNHKLVGRTSIWMFPIYGMAAVIKPVSKSLKRYKVKTVKRGLIYTAGIYATEYTTGRLLKKKNSCPWDYSKSKYNINGVVRLDYAPLWFIVGLFYEKILCDKK